MLTAKSLERIIELEDNLRSEYQAQLDTKTAEIDSCVKKQEEQQIVIEKQLTQLAAQSKQATENKRVEQLNRELNHRSEKLEDEVASQKKRLKALQKDLAEERAQIKTLKQFDAATLKKNLDAGKKKLVEKTKANDLLHKSANKFKAENAELQRKVVELEAKLAELEDTESTEITEITEDAEKTPVAAEVAAA
jgi:chromosome segregation ATPase